jgi:hypothetical protein
MDEEQPRDENIPGSDGQKETLRIPYDWQRPTAARAKSRLWNKDEPRMFPPKSFGAGWTLNFYWLVHMSSYFANKKRTK